ncbi:MAG: endonuclease III domain-containing protein [Chloroflexota bacterium]
MSVPEPPLPLREHLLRMYERLLDAYGPQGWWPGAADPFEVVVGAILTQSVSWKNVEQALANLRAAGALSPHALLALDDAELAALIRPSGYYTVKARRLRAFVQLVVDEFGGDLTGLFALPLPDLRAKLLATYGIGQETADDILVYAARLPSFVVDVYAVRVFTRLGISPASLAGKASKDAKPGDLAFPPVLDARRYQAWQRLFMDHLPADVALFNEYHALIVRHGVVRCRKRTPHCRDCPLLDLCPTGQELLPNCQPVLLELSSLRA